MLAKLIRRICDNREKDSLSTKLRKRRFHIFLKFIFTLKPPIRILDVGGTEEYWKNLGFVNKDGITVTLLNLKKVEISICGFKSVEGDVRDMGQFRDKEFDVVFSNSLIEHLNKYEEQLKAAQEIKRVSKRYFIQTPNYYFPIEPHFLFPMFQFFPERLKIFLIMHFNMGWYPRQAERRKAEEIIKSINLLKRKELQELFPEAIIYEEKFLGLTKSFIVYKWI